MQKVTNQMKENLSPIDGDFLIDTNTETVYFRFKMFRDRLYQWNEESETFNMFRQVKLNDSMDIQTLQV